MSCPEEWRCPGNCLAALLGATWWWRIEDRMEDWGHTWTLCILSLLSSELSLLASWSQKSPELLQNPSHQSCRSIDVFCPFRNQCYLMVCWVWGRPIYHCYQSYKWSIWCNVAFFSCVCVWIHFILSTQSVQPPKSFVFLSTPTNNPCQMAPPSFPTVGHGPMQLLFLTIFNFTYYKYKRLACCLKDEVRIRKTQIQYVLM